MRFLSEHYIESALYWANHNESALRRAILEAFDKDKDFGRLVFPPPPECGLPPRELKVWIIEVEQQRIYL